jgi:integrase
VTKKRAKQNGDRAHGLRKASATIAAESGASVSAMFGWSGHQMPQLYTKKADHKKLAARAMAKWKRPSSDDVMEESVTYLQLESERE